MEKKKKWYVFWKFRFEVLEKIHEKQQCLDSLDYLIYKVREGTFDK